jgi:hypothetical protein
MAESHSLTDDVTFTALLPQEKKFLFIFKNCGNAKPGLYAWGVFHIFGYAPLVA